MLDMHCGTCYSRGGAVADTTRLTHSETSRTEERITAADDRQACWILHPPLARGLHEEGSKNACCCGTASSSRRATTGKNEEERPMVLCLLIPAVCLCINEEEERGGP